MLIFPFPQEIQVKETYFKLNEDILILVPEKVSTEDLFLARFLLAELTDRYGLSLKIKQVQELPLNNQFILMGSINNSLVNKYCAQHYLKITNENSDQGGYILEVKDNIVVVAGSDNQGAFYGMQSLRQLIKKEDNQLQIQRVRDWPYKPFRGLRLFLPGRENIPFFKRFVRNFMEILQCLFEIKIMLGAAGGPV